MKSYKLLNQHFLHFFTSIPEISRLIIKEETGWTIYWCTGRDHRLHNLSVHRKRPQAAQSVGAQEETTCCTLCRCTGRDHRLHNLLVHRKRPQAAQSVGAQEETTGCTICRYTGRDHRLHKQKHPAGIGMALLGKRQQTTMHSSRMRTARLLTVSGKGSLPGGALPGWWVCLEEGDLLGGGGGLCL